MKQYRRKTVLKEPLATRLYARVTILGPDDCWPYTGPLGNHGYGVISTGWAPSHCETTHRAAWFCTHGPIPDGKWVLHRCDFKPCCNSNHLFLGDALSNVQDMDAKGRRVNSPHNGEKNGFSKLCEADVICIRRRVANGEHIPTIAKDYGITRNNIYYIRDGKAWKHLLTQGNQDGCQTL